VSTVELKDIGKVHRLSIPIPDNGGVVILKGRNDLGKTTTLQAVDTLVTGRGAPTVRQGAARGELEGFGAKLTVGAKKRIAGELEVMSLEGKLDASDLVDPGIDNDEKADAKRIKALVTLAGVEADPALFYDLVGGKGIFESLLPAKELASERDIVALAGKIKRGLDAIALAKEKEADNHAGQAVAHRKAADNVDLDVVTDQASLQKSLEEVVGLLSKLKQEYQAGTAAKQKADDARKQLEALGGRDAQKELDAANEEVLACSKASEAADAEWNRINELLNAATKVQGRAFDEKMTAIRNANAADKAAKTFSAWQELITAGSNVYLPSDDLLAEAQGAVDRSRKAIELGALARQARDKIAEAEIAEKAAKDAKAKAAILRRASAGGVDEVLSEQVQKLGIKLRVEAGRLVLDTDRGVTYFGDLSDGTRWTLVIDLCVDVFPQDSQLRPMLVIPQGAWEGIDPINREQINAHAIERGVLILTAECTSGEEIVAESMSN
jgi:hypothetical protein